MTNKKTIFFFCYRMLEFKLFVNAEILEETLNFANLVIFVPDDFCEDCRKICPKSVKVLPIRYPSFKLGTKSVPTLKMRLEAMLRNVCSLTYANKNGGTPCHSQKSQLRGFIRAKTNLTPIRRILSLFIVLLAIGASKSSSFRKTIQKVLENLLATDVHAKEYEEYMPSIVVVGSMGVDVDGNVIAEAKRHGVRSLVINQSWDRIVTKGYPPVAPDFLIVWSEIMRNDACRYLDMPREKTFVEGAAPFDFIFKENVDAKSKQEFFDQLGLDPAKLTFFFPLPSSFWHQDTVNTLQRLTDELSTNETLKEKQFIIRLHPFYWGEPDKREEVLKKLEALHVFPNVHVDLNKVDVRSTTVFIDSDDQQNLLRYYRHCNACVSVGSTVMIEMSCFKKPVFNIIFGNWITPNENIPYKDYSLHHLVELQKYSTIRNCFSFEELIAAISSYDDSMTIAHDFSKFIDEVIGPNKGSAGRAFANRMRYLIS